MKHITAQEMAELSHKKFKDKYGNEKYKEMSIKGVEAVKKLTPLDWKYRELKSLRTKFTNGRMNFDRFTAKEKQILSEIEALKQDK